MQLKDKVAIITGAGAGIGKETARLFAEQGTKILCNDISDSVINVVDEIKNNGGEATVYQGDISIAETAEKIINEAINKYYKIDILFNNAGIVIPGNAENTSLEDWDKTMRVNVRSVFLMSKFALPHLIKTRGCIVNNSSCLALKGSKDRLAYTASKGAILSMTRALAMDYAKSGVRVNCICPGVVDSPSFRQRISKFDDPEAARKHFTNMQPLGRIAEPREVAEGILYLVTSEICEGTILSADGGVTM
jgi:meso-butanediol dehydrogenase / (S,S)-butanediol dehydrogenase / diacetyl reductase